MVTEAKQVLEAANATILFGKNEKRAKINYRRLAKSIHPDMFSKQSDKDEANKAFQKLNELWESYNGSSNGEPNTTTTKTKPNTVKTSKREYALVQEILGDPFFTRFNATYDDGHLNATVLLTANSGDDDLTENHIRAIRKIQQDIPKEFQAFYPDIVELFQHEKDNEKRRGIVQTHHEGLVPFNKIMERYPKGISGRDVAWIFRRMLVAVGNAHDIGLVNSAITMDTLYIQPEQHGVVLSDWQYSVDEGQTLRAVPPKWKIYYPEIYLNKAKVTPSLDINMCAQVANMLLGKDEPKQFRTFFKVCSKEKTLDASTLLREFDILLERLYGKPKFHPFTLGENNS